MTRLVLVGGGHAHVSVLQAMAHSQLKDVDLTLITPAVHQNYSGMLPGWISGHYALAQCRIDLVRLAEATDAKLVLASVVGLNTDQRWLRLHDGRQISYDLLSLDVGSEANTSSLKALGDKLLAIRPLDDFYLKWPKLVHEAIQKAGFRLIVVGAGAAGIEIALAARHAFALQSIDATVTLVASEAGLLPGHSDSVQRRVMRYIRKVGIEVHLCRGTGTEGGVLLANGTRLAADCVIATTGAQAPVWLQTSMLSLDSSGYIAVDADHCSVSHPTVFAAGDVCSRVDVSMQRSGVHAVRAGPVLAANLIATLRGRALHPYRPKLNSLYLLACGPKYAIASWGAWSAEGQWVWKWKDWIDRRFIARFTKASTRKPQTI